MPAASTMLSNSQILQKKFLVRSKAYYTLHTSPRYNKPCNQEANTGKYPVITHCALDHARAIARSRPDNKQG